LAHLKYKTMEEIILHKLYTIFQLDTYVSEFAMFIHDSFDSYVLPIINLRWGTYHHYVKS
jgi:hypothetical protein